MSFKERNKIAKKFENLMDDLLKEIGFKTVNISYEEKFPKEIREKLRFLYDVPEVLFVRFQPDRFAYLNEKETFLVEYKICNTPIKFSSRVEHLKKISNDKTLNKSNVGAIEATAYHHYVKLAKTFNLRFILIIYSRFHPNRIVADYVNNIRIKNESEVIYGTGNASRTPYVNVNLDEFEPLNVFLQNKFGIIIEKKTYRKILKEMER
ncbi:MAG: hypothetical protein J7J33_05960 [Caldisericia bacterium]|nr:hypothetical protein [Caldisericia bacterium]